MTALHRSQTIRDLCAEALAALADTSKAVKIAVVLSDDGFEVASLNVDEKNGSRLASMTSSMQALGDAVAREMKMRNSKYLLIESANGHVLQQRVADHPLVVCAVFDERETVGHSVFAVGACSSAIAARMSVTAAA